jgi:hypothetical protein
MYQVSESCNVKICADSTQLESTLALSMVYYHVHNFETRTLVLRPENNAEKFHPDMIFRSEVFMSCNMLWSCESIFNLGGRASSAHVSELTTPDNRFVWIRLFVDSNMLMKSLESIVILFQVLAWTTASSTPDILGEHNVTEPPNLLPYIINAAGGDDAFSAELERILRHASSLHHARQATFDDFMSGGASRIIKRLCFDDGECWATKISINNQAFADLVQSGIDSMQAIEKYCPNIRIPRVRGYSNCSTTKALRYYFMDWIDGKTLESEYIKSKQEIMENGVPTGKFELNVTLPENFGRQFASFIYYLTTCPILEEKSTFPEYS